MKHAPTIAGALLGIAFVVFGLNFFLNFIPMPPPPPADSLPGMFFGAFYPSGYLGLVKTLEILGGVLVAVPALRRLGLLVLGPILVNILAFHYFLIGPASLLEPVVLGLSALALYLVWADRKAFAALIRG